MCLWYKLDDKVNMLKQMFTEMYFSISIAEWYLVAVCMNSR